MQDSRKEHESRHDGFKAARQAVPKRAEILVRFSVNGAAILGLGITLALVLGKVEQLHAWHRISSF